MLNKEFWVLKPSSINWSRCTRIHSGCASTAGVQPFDDVYQGHRFSLLKTQSLIFVLGIYLDRCFKTVLYFTCITTAEWEWSSFNDQSTQDANALCDITSHVKCTATHKYWLGLFENIAKITFVEDNVWSKWIHLPRMAYFVLRCPSIMILLKMRNLYKKQWLSRNMMCILFAHHVTRGTLIEIQTATELWISRILTSVVSNLPMSDLRRTPWTANSRDQRQVDD